MNKKGFTLIEVLVVVGIIGLLSAVVLVGIGPFRAKGRDARRISDLRQVQSGLELYYTKNQNYPAAASWDALKTVLIAAGIGVSDIPNDPLIGRSYGYCKTADNYNYAVAAYLEDKDNSILAQSSSDATFPCTPALIGTPSDLALCSKSGNPTNKYCLTF